MTNRDDFSQPARRTLAARAGGHCSNPTCRALTSGPELEGAGSIDLGKAAHITAAAPGGCRYAPDLTATERSSVENGVWLCAKCADLIDKKAKDYPVALLQEWKRSAEAAARVGLETPHLFAAGQINAHTVATVLRYKTPSKYFALRRLRTPPGMEYRQACKFRPVPGQTQITLDKSFQMVLLDASFGPSPTATAFILILQNTGSAVEPQASITLRMNGGTIWHQELQSQQRCIPLSQPTGASVTGIAGFSVTNLMPNERIYAKLLSVFPGPFHAEYFASSIAKVSTPLLYDVEFGEPELVPSPPTDPQFKKKNFPFE